MTEPEILTCTTTMEVGIELPIPPGGVPAGRYKVLLLHGGVTWQKTKRRLEPATPAVFVPYEPARALWAGGIVGLAKRDPRQFVLAGPPSGLPPEPPPLALAEVRRQIGQRIVELCAVRCFTQAMLADRMQMDPRRVERIVKGEINLTLKTLVRIAEALGVPISSLTVAPASMERRGPGRPRKGPIGKG